MIVSQFLTWIDTANVAQRAAAATALGRAVIAAELPFEEQCDAEAALTLLVEDPSEKVRSALAEAVALSPRAPAQIVAALASDTPEVACFVLALSPLLDDTDLIDRVAEGKGDAQCLIAARAFVSAPVSAAIAEVGELDSCLTLLGNDCAEIASLSFRRMIERHGSSTRMRAALARDRRLPPDCRHLLIACTADAFRAARLVTAMVGPSRTDRVLSDACARSSLTLAGTIGPEEQPALVTHLRLRGELTPSLLVRAVAQGKIDFFGEAMIALTGQSAERVRTLLASGQDVALAALFRAAGLVAPLHPPLIAAIRDWRAIVHGIRVAGEQEVAWAMLEAVGGQAAQGELAALLRSIHLEALRANARSHAISIAAAA